MTIKNGLPLNVKELESKFDYYYSEIMIACYERDIDRIRKCYFALKALEKKALGVIDY